MQVSKLNFDKLEQTPRSARTIRVGTSGRSTKPTTPRPESFKNPILGLEVNLIKELQEVETNFHGASYQKRKILLDTLEALANTNLGFKKQILLALRSWRPPEKPYPGENEEVEAVTDLIRTQKELKGAQDKLTTQKAKVDALKKELEELRSDTARLVNETKDMKEKIYSRSDHFSRARKLNEEMHSLQESFNAIFEPKDDNQLTGKFADLARENDELRKQLGVLKFGLEVSSQITKRLQFIEKRNQ